MQFGSSHITDQNPIACEMQSVNYADKHNGSSAWALQVGIDLTVLI